MAITANQQKQIKDVRQERCKLVADARKIIDDAEKEGRKMSREEQGAWEEIMKKVDEMHERISTLERQAEAEDDEEDRDDEDGDGDEGRGTDGDDAENEDDEDDEEDGGDRAQHLPRYITFKGRRFLVVPKVKFKRNRSKPGATGRERREFRRLVGESDHEFRTRARRSTDEYRQVFFDYLHRGDAALGTRLAQRAIQADSDIVGGYLIAPQEFVARLIKFVNNYVFIRKKGTVNTLKAAQSLGAPSLDTDISNANWTSELDTGNEDTAMAFGKRELTPRPLAKRIKVSNKLLRMAALQGGASADNSVAGGGAEGLVRDRLGYVFGITEEQAFLTGSGSNQPLGIFTASSRGIDTSRDVLTGSSTGVTVDGLIAAKYNQKVQYWPRLEWIFHRAVLQVIRQLKDANGNYMWVPGGLGGEADTMLDIPVNMSEYAPSVLTTGNYVGALGDLSFYWIADAEQLEIQRLNELYAAANQTGFIARLELDGMPVLAEAFTRLKCN